MKALVLAAGIGSRLKPWTDFHPKALVEVGGRPMLARVLDHIIAAGIHDIIVNVHHFAPQIVDFLASHNFDAEITVSDESDLLLDTGGALRKVLPLLGNEPVLIHNADVLSTLSLPRLFESACTADAMLVVSPRKSSRRLVFDSTMQLRGWVNLETGLTKPAGFTVDDIHDSLMSFDGIHMVSPSLFPALESFAPVDTPFSIIDFYISNCTDSNIKGFKMPDGTQWWDVGKPATLEDARRHFDTLTE